MEDNTEKALSRDLKGCEGGLSKTAIQMEDTLEATCLPENRTLKLLS